MPKPTIRSVPTFIAIALLSANITLAQSANPSGTRIITVPNTTQNTWQAAQLAGPSKGKLFIVTVNQSHRRQTCHIQSFTPDKLVCSHVIGGPRTYRPAQIVALILPSDDGLKVRLALGLNGGVAGAIWGTVILAATCPACAVATGVVALVLVCAAGAILIGDEQPDRLLYLAPGQQLTGKLRFLHP